MNVEDTEKDEPSHTDSGFGPDDDPFKNLEDDFWRARKEEDDLRNEDNE